MSRPTDAERFVTQDEAVAMMQAAGIAASKRSVQRLITKTLLPTVPTPGGYHRLLRAGIEEFIRTHVDNDAT